MNETTRRALDALFDDEVVAVGDQQMRLRHYRLADLIVTSGHITVWDPGWVDEATPRLHIDVPVGRFPIVESVASWDDQSGEPVFVTLHLTQGKAIAWEMARFVAGRVFKRIDTASYPVDTGTAAFMDMDAAAVVADRMQDDVDASYYDATFVDESQYVDEAHLYAWGDVSLEPETEANVIFFSTGVGDGAFPVYLGYDDAHGLVCITTDFMALWPQS